VPTAILVACVLSLGVRASGDVTINVTVSFDTQSSLWGPFYMTSGEALLPVGALVRIGKFDISTGPNLTTIQTGNDFGAVDALFTPLAESIANAGVVAQASNPGDTLIINDFSGERGNIVGQIHSIQAGYAVAPGDRLFAWVFDTSDPLTATEWGIFSADSGDWDMPSDLGTETLATGEIDSVGTEVFRGSIVAGSGNLLLSPVPEPSIAAMLLSAGIGALAFRGRRRRRQRRRTVCERSVPAH